MPRWTCFGMSLQEKGDRIPSPMTVAIKPETGRSEDPRVLHYDRTPQCDESGIFPPSTNQNFISNVNILKWYRTSSIENRVPDGDVGS